MVRLALALVLLSSSAAVAGGFDIRNCTKGGIIVTGFNDSDELKLMYASKAYIDHGQTTSVTCATGACKVVITGPFPETEAIYNTGEHRCVVQGWMEFKFLTYDYEDCTPPQC